MTVVESVPYTRDDERELLARIKAGDAEACSVCIESHSPALYRLAVRLLGDEAEAEDVVQETFINAFKAIPHFDGRSSLGTWLYRIAYNNALMRLRARRDAISLDGANGADRTDRIRPIQFVAADGSPDAIIVEHESAQMLGDAINELPQSLREVFVLREMEDFSTAEAADKLGISEGAVKVRLHRARAALREQLGGYFDERVPPEPVQSLACSDALKFIDAAEKRGEPVDESLRTALRDYITACEQCRLLLDPKHPSVLFYCGEHENPVPKAMQRRLFERMRNLWAANAKRL
jgi:RNA polymerase sigma-70 factor (ECF subfamily)